jgi:hypothetical protein
MTTYFTSVSGEQGLNPTRENPCRLIDVARLVLRDGTSHTGQTGERECSWCCSAGAVPSKRAAKASRTSVSALPSPRQSADQTPRPARVADQTQQQ